VTKRGKMVEEAEDGLTLSMKKSKLFVTVLVPSKRPPSLHLNVLEFCFNTIICWRTSSSSISRKVPSLAASMLV